MKRKIQNFKTFKQLYKKYFPYYPATHIKFEGRLYEFKEARSLKEMCVHLYYCESEQHYMRIKIVNKKPFLIDMFYSTKEETLNNVRRVV